MAVDNGEWDGNRAMGQCSSAEDFRSICAGEHNVGESDQRQHWALPHHFLGQGPNADGVRNALSRLPQTEDLANRDAAQAHLDRHMAEIQGAQEQSQVTETITLDTEVVQRSLSAKQGVIGMRIVPFGVVAESRYGPLMFKPGAFGDVDPHTVRLRMDHVDPPTGLGTSYEDRADGAHMEFQVEPTSRGNDQRLLAEKKVSAGVSIGFSGTPQHEEIDGRTVQVFGPNSSVLEEVSTTWKPTFKQAEVMYVLSKDEEGEAPVAEPQETPATGPDANAIAATMADAVEKQLSQFQSHAGDFQSKILDRLEAIEDKARGSFSVPAAKDKKKVTLTQWGEWALRRLHGDPAAEVLSRSLSNHDEYQLALDDIVTADNPGAVPDAFFNDLDELIDDSRPFLESVRQVTAPREGMSITLPKISQRASMGGQSEEKAEVSGNVLKIGNETYDSVPIAGGADVSEQQLRRASSTYFDILMQDFAEAYAIDAEAKAIDALLTGTQGNTPADGGTLDPENLVVGPAFQTSLTEFRRRPDTIWLSSAATAKFIDAKNNGTNEPLWSVIRASITAGEGANGPVSGLRTVYVPALDDAGVDVIIGPSRGFLWAEDGAWRLEAAVPSRVGRDIVLAGLLFPMPRHASAFTTYVIAS